MSTTDANERRVVITGVGVISPIGNTTEEFWQSLTQSKSGVSRVEMLPEQAYPFSFAGAVRDFKEHISDFGELPPDKKKLIRKGLKVMCRETQMGLAAAQRAMADAGFETGTHPPERIGASFGTGYMVTLPEEFASAMQKCIDENEFDFSRWGNEGMRQVDPLWLLRYLPNMPACHIAIYNDFRGPNNSLTQGEVAANVAIGEAYHVIARGAADMMVTGATGTRLHPLRTIHTALQEQLATNGKAPEQACRPFDLNRSGMVVGEGASAIVLEEYEAAVQRGAPIYGELIGVGSSCVAGPMHVGDRRKSLANAIQAALRCAGKTPDDVGHVNAHGLSTKSSDIDEAQGLRDVFGERTDKLPVVAPKSFFGNLGAGSAAVEMAASLLALQHGHLFPVLNYETPDPECPISPVQTTDAPAGNSFINVSLQTNGQASCLLIQKME